MRAIGPSVVTRVVSTSTLVLSLACILIHTSIKGGCVGAPQRSVAGLSKGVTRVTSAGFIAVTGPVYIASLTACGTQKTARETKTVELQVHQVHLECVKPSKAAR